MTVGGGRSPSFPHGLHWHLIKAWWLVTTHQGWRYSRLIFVWHYSGEESEVVDLITLFRGQTSRKSPFQGSLLQNTELNFSLTLRSCDTFNTEISKPQRTAGMGEHTIRSWSRYAWKCQESISHGLRVPDLSTGLFFISRQSLRYSCFDFRVFERVPRVQCVPKQGDFDEMFGRNLISVLSV